MCINDVFFESVPFPLYIDPSLCTTVQTTRAFAILGLFTAPIAFALRVTEKIPLATAFYFVSSEVYHVSSCFNKVLIGVVGRDGGRAGRGAWVVGFFSRIYLIT